MEKFNLRLRHLDEVIEVAADKPLFAALRESGKYIRSHCGGRGLCGQCMIKVVSGADNLSPMDIKEIKLLGNVFHITGERLSCQTKISGDVEIDISHHEEHGDQQTLQKKMVRTTVRKKEDVERMYNDREEQRLAKEEKRQAEPDWVRHWEKKGENPDASPTPKRLGGNRRPHFFKSDDANGVEDLDKKKEE